MVKEMKMDFRDFLKQGEKPAEETKEENTDELPKEEKEENAGDGDGGGGD